MSLSRKNYEAIAAIVAAGLADTDPANHGDLYRYGDDAEDLANNAALESVAGRLADYFAADNPRFDRARFLAACGVAE